MDSPLNDPVRRACAAIAAAVLDGRPVDPRLGNVRLAPHQVTATSRLLDLIEQHGCALLADATGMGKTFVAIAVARSLGGALVVGPAALRGMWRDALYRAGRPMAFHSFEALSRGTAPADVPIRLLILDEAHHARNPTSRRYAMLAELAWGRRLLCLTATPVHNAPRDLRALFALSLGSRAWHEPAETLHGLVVRRTALDASPSGATASHLPRTARTQWRLIAPDPATAAAIERLPPAVPVADGGTAHALVTLGLVRAWASSSAALRATLVRRLRRAAAMTAVLDAGRVPTGKELASWCVVDDSVQLGFPELLVQDTLDDTTALRSAIDAHCAGIRGVLDTLAAKGPAQDEDRCRHVASILQEHDPAPVLAFTQFTDTAEAMYRYLSRLGGVALVTGRGARIASGRLPSEEVVALLDDPAAALGARRRLPVRLLIATDVLSEGLSLRLAGVVVHLDLPWTVARLEQRVGRLRRPGSPHRVVHVHAIGPPIGTRAMSRLVRVLRRKAYLVAPFAGSGTDPIEELLDLRRHPGGGSAHTRDSQQTTERLRDIIACWRDPGCSSTAREPVEHWIAVRVALPAAWLAICLVRHGDRWRLLRVGPDGASERPHELRRVAELIEAHRSGDASWRPVGRPSAHQQARAVVERWLEATRSLALVSHVVETPSASHAGVLRHLDALLAQARRAERPVLRPMIERCRDLVLASRGIGAEHALAEWLSSSSGDSRDMEDVRRLSERLEGRVASREVGSAPDGSITVVVGLFSDPAEH